MFGRQRHIGDPKIDVEETHSHDALSTLLRFGEVCQLCLQSIKGRKKLFPRILIKMLRNFPEGNARKSHRLFLRHTLPVKTAKLKYIGFGRLHQLIQLCGVIGRCRLCQGVFKPGKFFH